jgi:hypothetical protein
MTAVEYISDMEEIFNASWSLFQHVVADEFTLSERLPVPPALSAKDLRGGPTEIINVLRIRRINLHPVKSDEDSAPESISDTEDWLNWNGDLENSNNSEDDCMAEFESNKQQDNSIEDPQCPEQRDVSVAQNVSGLIRPTRKHKRQAEKLLVIVNAMETRRQKGVEKY